MNPQLLSLHLQAVFDIAAPNGASQLYANLGHGDFPPSPVSTTLVTGTSGNVLSGVGSTYGLTVFPKSAWSIPSKGATMLIGNVALTTVTSIARVPTFVRLGTTALIGTSFGIDASVDVVKGSGNFVIDRLDAVAGMTYSLKDARLKIRTTGAFSVNNTIANAILASLTGNASMTSGYAGAFMLGLPYVNKNDGTPQAAPILLEAFDGPVPLSANDESTGTKLWSKSISSTVGANIFSIINNAIALQGDTSAAIIANGIPTYVRITKAAATATLSAQPTLTYPKGVIQAPVGDGVNEVTFDKSIFVAGQTATLNSFTMIFYPNLI